MNRAGFLFANAFSERQMGSIPVAAIGRARYSLEGQCWREKLMGRRDVSLEPLDRQMEVRKAGREKAIEQAMETYYSRRTLSSKVRLRLAECVRFPWSVSAMSL
jgi:hypothetical protein